jgi:cation diffusion facilitator family transporter
MYGARVASKPPDIDHPYGHGKLEYTASLGITLMIFVAAINLGREAIERLFENVSPVFSYAALVAIVLSTSFSLGVWVYEGRVGKKVSSIILVADARHSLTDVFASIVVVLGFLGAALGLPYTDSLAGVGVCLVLGYVGFNLFRQSTDVLVDRGISLQTIGQIRDIVRSLGLDVDSHDVRGRKVGDKMFVDMHITVSAKMPLRQAHNITEVVEHQLKRRIRGIQEVIIHIEPHEEAPGNRRGSRASPGPVRTPLT